ncbi:hypothetical protein [Arthrobacter sp. Br18]|uniref:hypothetical protein n=1 Tax=Arthrobacter sp. Br18 TaxID=1312954 RepID=UPI0004BAD304|nr:hypothetical protein [Arthrobacter sp. Br18]
MPITIITPDGTHAFDAKPEEVTFTGPVLKIIRGKDGITVATFRRWNSWFETPTTEEKE